MNKQPFLSAIVMACGKGRRFGGNKLTTLLDGKALIRYTLDALPAHRFGEILVVTCHPEVMELVSQYPAPFGCIRTDDEQGEQDSTIRCGVRELSLQSEGCLFVAADQPLKLTSSLEQQVDTFVECWQRGEERFVALSFAGKKGNPVFFPKSSYPQLAALLPGQTGSTVLKAHPEQLVLSPAQHPWEMADVDTPEDLLELERIVQENICRNIL